MKILLKKLARLAFSNSYKSLVFHFSIIAIFSVLLFLFLHKYFLYYTNRNQIVTVPNLIGMTIEESIVELKNRNLYYEIYDSTYICPYNNGHLSIKDPKSYTIIRQQPEPSSRVKSQRKIYVTVNRISPPNVDLHLEQIIGRSVSYVKSVLSQNCVETDIHYVQDFALDAVISINNASNSKNVISIPKGSVVYLKIGNGEKKL